MEFELYHADVLTSFIVYFVFGYADVLCVYSVKLLSGFFGDMVWLFLVKTGWQPCLLSTTSLVQ